MAELQQHFKMDYEAILPRLDCVIRGEKYRFTVLSDLLIRLEYSEAGKFEDRPTELVMNRRFGPVNFEKKEDSKYLTIKTSYFSLTYQKNMPFTGGKMAPPDQFLRVDLNGTDKYWFYNHPEVRNFRGSSFSLDGTDGRASYSKGLYSTDGFVSIDDSNSLIFNQDGTLGKRSDKRVDIYLFMYRRDFGACLRDYFTLTGYPPMIPRYALGVWWNRNIEYDARGIEKLIFQFDKYKMPLSVLLLGNGWHRQMPNMKSGMSFNEQLFKRPKRLTDYLHSKNIRLSVKINPTEGIAPIEDYYLPYKKATGIETQKEDDILPFNVFNKNILSAYFDYMVHPLMNLGVDFFWIDYNNAKDLPTARALNHYHFTDFKQIKNRRGLILSRNGGKAAHRYPIQYTGETKVSWRNLKLFPIFNSTGSNLGLSWISNDIGGFTGGTEDGELYARFVQFGCFSPILRLSSDKGRYYKREPWRWDITTEAVVAKYLRLRHQLIPYLYSESYRYHKTGLPLVQPLYYRYPEIYDEPLYQCEYYFGSNLFVAPITSKREPLIDRTILKLFLPDGVWYDLTTGKKYKGGKRYTTFYKMEDYPAFVRAGTVVPLAVLNDEDLNNTNPPKSMEIQVFPGASSSYELYEDDGLTSLYEQGYYLVTNIDYSYQPNNFTVIIRPIAGKSGIVPAYRSYKIRFKNTKEPDDISIHIGDEKVRGVQTYVDDNDFVVQLPPLSTLKQITVNCRGEDIEIEGMRLINDDIDSILNDLPIETRTKEQIGNILFSDTDIKTKRIQIRKLKTKGLHPKYINLFLKLLEYIAEI